MRRVALFVAACVVVVSAASLRAQEADLIMPAVNPPAASQPVPRLILLSGTVKDLVGKPLTGPVDLNFAIYKEQTDAAPLWQESQTLNVDEQGHYTSLLGAMQPQGLPVDLFTSGEARWLGVSVGRLAEQPRVLLVSVPYALKANDAEMLGGKPASAYMLAPPSEANAAAGNRGAGVRGPSGAAIPDAATPGKPKSGPKPDVAGTGTQNYIPVWTNSSGTLGNSVIYQSSGSVGIGTTAPVATVDVNGTNAGLQLRGTGTHQVAMSGATSGRLGQDAAGLFFTSDTNGGALRFYTNNGSGHEGMRITSAANVGIGTTTPAYPLDVQGSSVRIANPSGTTQLIVAGSATSGRLGQDAAGFFFSSDSNGAALRFGTNNGSGHEWMRITSAGFVGIGTTTPLYPLDVQGSSARIANPSGPVQLMVAGSVTNGRLGQDTGGLFLSSDSNGAAIRFATNNGSGHEWMRITGAGLVGIGTATPAHVLDVVGDIKASTNIIAGGNLTVTGTISGNGAGLGGVNALSLGGFAPAAFEQIVNKNATNGYAGLDGTSRIAKARAPATTVYTDAGNTFSAGTQDFSAVVTLPVQSVLTASTPASCAANKQLLIKTDASPPGQQLFVCNATGNGWNLVGDGSAGGVLSFNTRTGAVVPTTGDYSFSNISGTVGSTQLNGTYSNALNLSNTSNVYAGNGSGLQNLQPGNLAAGQANIDISGSASFAAGAGDAGNAESLGGQSPGFYANTGSNTYSGDQTITSGNLNLDQTSGGGAGVINLGGSPFIHAYGTSNTFVGTGAGNFSTTGTQNTAHGNSALSSNSTGSGNTASGVSALSTNTAGSSNSAHGTGALLNNSDGSFNSASGAGALQFNCKGVSAGCGANYNTALGYSAGVTGTTTNANMTGASNTFVGALSGPGTTTQLTNAAAIGAHAVVAQSNTIVLGSINGVNGATASVNVGIGTATPATSLQVVGDIRLGTTGTNGCLQNFAGTALAGTCSSDARLKTNIQPFSPVLGKLVQLQPVHYIWNVAAYPQYHFGPGTNSGLIAQEVEKVFPELVSVDAKGLRQVNYSELPYLMLQAIRELKAENDTLRGEVEQLNAKNQKISDLTRQVEELHKVQQQMATLEARLAEMEARTPKP